MKYYDKLIFELSRPGRVGYELPANQFATDGESEIPADLLRKARRNFPK